MIPLALTDIIRYEQGNRFVKSLYSKFSSSFESLVILIQGDSTGNENHEWFYQTMLWLASKNPKYTFKQRLWNRTNEGYDSATTIQIGLNGEGHVYFDGSDNSNVSTPNPSGVINGDLDIRIKMLPNYSSENHVFDGCYISKLGDSPNRSLFYGVSGGKPYLWWSSDGSTLLGGTNSYAHCDENIPYSTEPFWLRCVLDVDNGSNEHTVTHYLSDDGINWNQLGSVGIGTGITSVNNTTEGIVIGMRSSSRYKGKIFELEIRDGIDGKLIISPDFGMTHPFNVSTFNDGEGNIYTPGSSLTLAQGSPLLYILNASTPGTRAEYSADTTRFELQTPLKPELAFISYAHNYTTDIDVTTDITTLFNKLLEKYPNTGIVLSTQNPQRPSANIYEYWENQVLRNAQIATMSAVNNFGLIDACKAFNDYGDLTLLVESDGVHPTALGYEIWKNAAINFLNLTKK